MGWGVSEERVGWGQRGHIEGGNKRRQPRLGDVG